MNETDDVIVVQYLLHSCHSSLSIIVYLRHKALNCTRIGYSTVQTAEIH